jgi:hypothetical protein
MSLESIFAVERHVLLHRMSVDSGSGPTFHPPPAPLSGTVVCDVGALHATVPKATLDFFVSFHVLVRVSVMGGLSSFEGRPTSHLAATCTHVFADSVCGIARP